MNSTTTTDALVLPDADENVRPEGDESSKGAPDPTTPQDGATNRIALRLRDRTVVFTGARAATLLDFEVGLRSNPGEARDALVLFVTGLGNVAVHDPIQRTLEVLDVDEFFARFHDTPVGWVVDEVLERFPQPIEHLDI
jgi:hypothetical protein